MRSPSKKTFPTLTSQPDVSPADRSSRKPAGQRRFCRDEVNANGKKEDTETERRLGFCRYRTRIAAGICTPRHATPRPVYKRPLPNWAATILQLLPSLPQLGSPFLDRGLPNFGCHQATFSPLPWGLPLLPLSLSSLQGEGGEETT